LSGETCARDRKAALNRASCAKARARRLPRARTFFLSTCCLPSSSTSHPLMTLPKPPKAGTAGAEGMGGLAMACSVAWM